MIRSLALLSLTGLLAACGESELPVPPAEPEQPVAAVASAALFSDQATALGLGFRHDPVLSGALLMPEILGAGAALADLDGDGDLDLLLVQGRPGAPADGEAVDDPAAGSQIYRNRLVEDGQLAFERVTAASGLRQRCYGTGVAAGDIDNDGLIDLYLLCDGPNELWHNQGGMRFREIAAGTAAADSAWTGAAAFVDIDGDGRLDLYIGNYLDYPEALRRPCRSSAGVPDYCGPLTHDAAPDRLLRNLGDGRFEDISAVSGVAATAHGPALGVVAADFNGDGRQDLYVANDAHPNKLWINQADGRLVDEALLAGVAVNSDGQPEGSMGVDAGDYDGDGDDDLFMVHIADEKATLYAARSDGVFDDRSLASGVGALTRGHTGFGTAWIDVDHDGWLDLLIVNGRVRMTASMAALDGLAAYAQTMLLLRNDGQGRFVDASAAGGAAFALPRVGRGAAFGDLDNDGDVDVVVNNAGDPPFVLLAQGTPPAWLGLELLEHGRAAHGARAGLELSDGHTLWRRVRIDGSYASANDGRIQFSHPAELKPLRLQLQWPDGGRQRIEAAALPARAYLRIERARATTDTSADADG